MATSDPVARMRDAAPVLRACADNSESDRCLLPEAHDALMRAGVFDLYRPKSLGGEETNLPTFGRVIAEASAADGSAGWCAMISGVYGAFGAMLPREGAEEVFSPGPTIIAGALGPQGMAIPVDGGYRVSGRWTFGSNSPYAEWFVGGCLVIENGAPVALPNGAPKMIEAVFPRDVVTIIDTWHTIGLKGTSSNDYACEEVFVPASRVFAFSDQSTESGPLYRIPMIAGFSTAIAAVSVGIARHALQIVRDLAAEKKPSTSQITMQQKSSVQDRVGVALATVNAAQAYLEREVTGAWVRAERGEPFGLEERGRLWLASTHTGQMCLAALNDLYMVSGGSAVYRANQLERCVRDARTAVQHVVTQYVNYETAGKQFLGLPVHDTIWSIDVQA